MNILVLVSGAGKASRNGADGHISGAGSYWLVSQPFAGVSPPYHIGQLRAGPGIPGAPASICPRTTLLPLTMLTASSGSQVVKLSPLSPILCHPFFGLCFKAPCILFWYDQGPSHWGVVTTGWSNGGTSSPRLLMNQAHLARKM
jgi:hypothetical protein